MRKLEFLNASRPGSSPVENLSRSICDLQSRIGFHALQIEGQTNLSVTGIWWCKHCQGCNHDPNCMAPSAQLAFSRHWPNRLDSQLHQNQRCDVTRLFSLQAFYAQLIDAVNSSVWLLCITVALPGALLMNKLSESMTCSVTHQLTCAQGLQVLHHPFRSTHLTPDIPSRLHWVRPGVPQCSQYYFSPFSWVPETKKHRGLLKLPFLFGSLGFSHRKDVVGWRLPEHPPPT